MEPEHPMTIQAIIFLIIVVVMVLSQITDAIERGRKAMGPAPQPTPDDQDEPDWERLKHDATLQRQMQDEIDRERRSASQQPRVSAFGEVVEEPPEEDIDRRLVRPVFKPITMPAIPKLAAAELGGSGRLTESKPLRAKKKAPMVRLGKLAPVNARAAVIMGDVFRPRWRDPYR
jgi:hypothetical protein